MNYHPRTNTFDDGTWLDWLVWEPPSAARLADRKPWEAPPADAKLLMADASKPMAIKPVAANGPQATTMPLTEAHWDAIAIPFDADSKLVVLQLNVHRDGQVAAGIPVQAPCSVRQLLQVIHDFYARPVETLESIAHIPTDDPYSTAVQAAVTAGQPARWLDLVGSSTHVQDTLAHMSDEDFAADATEASTSAAQPRRNTDAPAQSAAPAGDSTSQPTWKHVHRGRCSGGVYMLSADAASLRRAGQRGQRRHALLGEGAVRFEGVKREGPGAFRVECGT